MEDVNLSSSLTLKDVLLVTNFKYSLISTHKLTYGLNYHVIYDQRFCTIQNQASKRKIESGDLHKRVYAFTKRHQQGFMGATRKDTTILWHTRMRHSSNQILQHISHLVKCNFDRANCYDVLSQRQNNVENLSF